MTIVWYIIGEIWNNGGSKLVWQIAGLLFLAAFPVLPIAFMWTSTGMGAGFNTAITLLVVLMLATLIVGLSWGD